MCQHFVLFLLLFYFNRLPSGYSINFAKLKVKLTNKGLSSQTIIQISKIARGNKFYKQDSDLGKPISSLVFSDCCILNYSLFLKIFYFQFNLSIFKSESKLSLGQLGLTVMTN